MVEGTQESPTTVHAQIAGRPNHRSSDIHSEYGVISGDFIEDFGDVLWMDRALAGLSRRQIVEPFARFAVVIETDIEISGVSLLHYPRQQCRERFRSASNNTEVQMTAPSELFFADIDLQNAGILGIELLVGEIRSQHQQSVAIHHGVIARGEPQEAGHANVIGIVALNKLFPAHGVHNWRLELRGQLD